MPDGATERNNLATIELHIVNAEMRIAELSANRDLLTATDEEALHREMILLEYLIEQRQMILVSWRRKHDPSRQQA